MTVDLRKRAHYSVKIIVGDSLQGDWLHGQIDRDVFRLRDSLVKLTDSPVMEGGAFIPTVYPDASGRRYNGYKAYRHYSVAEWGTVTMWIVRED